MGFSRFFNLFLFGLIIISCHEEKRNANINIQLDDFADWNIREYSLSSRKIRHEIDSLRLLPLKMYADEHTRKYYASSAPFLWITRSGIDEKADTLLTYLQKASLAGRHRKQHQFRFRTYRVPAYESLSQIRMRTTLRIRPTELYFQPVRTNGHNEKSSFSPIV